MSTLLITGASWLLAVTGGFFLLTGSIGLLRMPDFFTRVHAASLIDSLGALLILVSTSHTQRLGACECKNRDDHNRAFNYFPDRYSRHV